MPGLLMPQPKPCHPSFIPVILVSALNVRITDDEGWPYLSATAQPWTEVFVSPTWRDQEHCVVWCEGQTAIVDRDTLASVL